MIFDMLKKDSFTEDWIVLHSLNLAQHTKRLYGEIDFLLLIPNAGIFVMEVKGGDVRCRNGEWEFIDRHGNVNKNKSPFTQARDAMFSLKEEIKKEKMTNCCTCEEEYTHDGALRGPHGAQNCNVAALVFHQHKQA